MDASKQLTPAIDIVDAFEQKPIGRLMFASPALSMASAATAMSITNFVFNPIDVVKTKLQLQCQLSAGSLKRHYASTADCFRRIALEDGVVRGLWHPGLFASLLQGIANASVRMGLFPTAVQAIQDLRPVPEGAERGPPGLGVKMVAGMCTGFLGAFIGNPMDIVKVRLQGEAGSIYGGVFVTGLRRGETPSPGTIQCFRDLAAADSIWNGLLRGVAANCLRAALVTSSQMSSYDETKRFLEHHPVGPFENESARVGCSSFVAGLSTSVVAAPVDLLRSRIMADARRPGEKLYKGSIDCVVKTVKAEGVFAMWKGVVPFYMRLGPQFMLAFPLLELVRTRVFGLAPL